MMIDSRTIECPHCEKFMTQIVFLSRNNFHESEIKKFKVSSDGYENAESDMRGFYMCPECLEIFNLDSAKRKKKEVPVKKTFSESVLSFFRPKSKKEEEKVEVHKEIIGEGIEFLKKAFKVVDVTDKARYAVVLRYIWEIERLDEEKKKIYIEDYNTALSEIIEILDFKIKNVPDMDDCNHILSHDSATGGLKRNYEMEAAEYNEKRNMEVLMLAEFYRRKGMFDRAVEILDENECKMFENYLKLAVAIKDHAMEKKSELFYLEFER